ncbi:uncharacterized protein LOC128929458 [Callithrix jacchus]|uniref:uncharacterized protein LOC128929458 n=1 Tax=Callithrix jacchus TaxID=9483 RepID=UPI0023DD0F1E|nr:uncharacterized protein LOC128929458 [Callithrix jacchus]
MRGAVARKGNQPGPRARAHAVASAGRGGAVRWAGPCRLIAGEGGQLGGADGASAAARKVLVLLGCAAVERHWRSGQRRSSGCFWSLSQQLPQLCFLWVAASPKTSDEERVLVLLVTVRMGDGVSFCHPDWSAMAQTQLSASRVQAILLLQLSMYLGLHVPATTFD